MKSIVKLVFFCFVILPCLLQAKEVPSNPQVELKTNFGTMIIELDEKHAPNTVQNFIQYVNDKYYDGTIFHRIISDFMIQGGGFTADFVKKPVRDAIKNEADNGLKNDFGNIAMARTSDPHSATAQFFINSADNDFLNHRAKTPRGWGYTVFGKVIKGKEVINKIQNIKTGPAGPFGRDVPKTTVLIENMRMITNDDKGDTAKADESNEENSKAH